MPPTRLWCEPMRPWLFTDSLNPLSRRSQSSRSESPALDAYALSKILWSEDSEDEDEVENHLLAGETTCAGTRRNVTEADDDDETDNPDENEVDGLIDTFEVGAPERSFCRIASWRASVTWPGDYDHANRGPVLLPISSNHKRKRSSLDLREQSPFKKPKLLIDQPICPACNSTFVSKNNLLKHGRRARASEACREAISYAFE